MKAFGRCASSTIRVGRRVPLCALVLFAVVWAPPGAWAQSRPAAVAAAMASGFDESATLRACLARPADELRNREIYAEPITALFIDARTKPVDLVLCVASSVEWRLWYLLDRRARDFSHAYLDFGDESWALAEVRGLRASPDGKYLAVHASAEGHPSITVVDLPTLVRERQYRPVGDSIDSYPGTVSIRSWNDGALEVTSDALLSAPLDRSHHLLLLSDETFRWDFHAGTVVPVREALRDPVRYYAAALSSPQAAVRREAIASLGELQDLSAVPVLERALGVETDAAVLAEIRGALDGLSQTAGVLNGCLAGSRDDLRAADIWVLPVETLSVDGKPQLVDELLCVVNESRDPSRPRARGWFRIDQAGPSPEIRRVPSGGGDRVQTLSASPDGRYLAIQYLRKYEESVGYVETVDLPMLMRGGLYKPVARD